MTRLLPARILATTVALAAGLGPGLGADLGRGPNPGPVMPEGMPRGDTRGAPDAVPDPEPNAAPDAFGNVSQIYDVYLGGIFAGEIIVDAEFDARRYRASALLRTAGIVAVFYKAQLRAEAAGRVTGERLAPGRFTANTRDPKKTQFVEMIYRNGDLGEIRAEPAFQPKPWQIDPMAQSGTTDPLTGLLAALAPVPRARLCNRRVEVFDGRRRYAIELKKPEMHRRAVRCRAVFRRIAGYKPKLMKKKRATWPFRVWFKPGSDGIYRVVRVMGATPFGTAVARKRPKKG